VPAQRVLDLPHRAAQAFAHRRVPRVLRGLEG
jgi:hypothetical protein